MKRLFIPLLIAAVWSVTEPVSAHGSEDHASDAPVVEKNSDTSPVATPPTNEPAPEPTQTETAGESVEHGEASHPGSDAASMLEPQLGSAKPGPVERLGRALRDFSLADFPTLHPMVVHVPVIMIPLALLFGLLGIFIARRYILTLALGFAAAGLLGGYIAAFPMHPHTRGLSAAAARTLQQHDFFAYSTLGVTAFAVAVAVLALLKPSILIRCLLALTLLLASLSVSVTAHYGGTLTYVHGVGVKGNYLDTH